jgi:hypothetical protein
VVLTEDECRLFIILKTHHCGRPKTLVFHNGYGQIIPFSENAAEFRHEILPFPNPFYGIINVEERALVNLLGYSSLHIRCTTAF